MADERLTHVTLEEFIADVTAPNFFKDNPHLVDKASIARWVYLHLKAFGRNVMDMYEEVIQIQNYKGEFPENFDSLSLAVFCEADTIEAPEDSDLVKVQTDFYRQKLSCFEDQVCEGCMPQCDSGECTETIVEHLYVEGTKLKLYYKNPTYVKISSRSLSSKSCAGDCVNRNVKNSPFSINVRGRHIDANFKEGFLYVRYYGMPMDEDCLPLIPSSPNGYLERYLEAVVRNNILEDAIWSDDAPNKQNIFSFSVQKEQDLFNKAKSDTSRIDMVAMHKAIGHNRRRRQAYFVNLGALDTNYSSSYFPSGNFSNRNPNPFNF